MRIGISFKWTVSAVLLVIIVVCVYAFFTISDTQASVELETERIQRIQYESLDQLGSQSTRSISQPASGLLFDNDREGLTRLLAPAVEVSDDKGYFAVYATIIAPNGRVWSTVVNSGFDKIELAGIPYFDRDEDSNEVKEVSKKWLKENITEQKLPNTQDIVVKTKEKKGGTVFMNIRQYTHAIQSNEGDTQAYLLIGYTIDGLKKEIDEIKAQGEERKNEALSRSILLALVAVIIGLIVGILQSLLVTRNIKKLSKVAGQIANGDLSVRTDVHSSDEIGQLGDQFNTMADRVQALMVETEQKAMLEKEINITRDIQSRLMPPDGFATCGPVSLNGYFQPATQCGGDFWSYHQLPDGSVLLTIGDVTGHGVPSAMITACAKSALDTLINLSPNNINLSMIMAGMNIAICQAAKGSLFMTFQAIHISANGRFCEIANAAHNFPLIVSNGSVKGFTVRGERLGDNPNARYEVKQEQLNPGDTLLLYTDGLTEYQNEAGKEYGEKALRKAIAQSGQMDVNQCMKNLWDAFSAFRGNAPQTDDITLMFVRV